MSNAKIILNYLKSNPATLPNGEATPSPGLNGGIVTLDAIYDHPLKKPSPDDNRGSTPLAFSESGAIKPALVVRSESMTHHYQFRRLEKATVDSIIVWIYAPSHDNGKLVAEAARVRLDLLLDNLVFVTDQGLNASLLWNFHLSPMDNHHEFSGSLVAFTRYHVDFLRGQEF